MVWATIIYVALTIGAAVAIAWLWGGQRPVLPLQHVAAAAVIGVIGWEALVNIPSFLAAYQGTYAGIQDAPNQGLHLAFVVAGVAYVACAAGAIVGLLARRLWGVGLGVGVSIGRIITAVSGIRQMLGFADQFAGGDPYLWYMSLTVGAGAIPALAAIVLLAWPFVTGRGAGVARDAVEVEGIEGSDLAPRP
jgi:hypothetical protein